LLYVIEKGTFNCYKRIEGVEKLVKTYEEGESFGELALLYNAPRAASVIASSNCSLFALDRECFNKIVK
jgi:cAMP-dependent protein kinase regulator